MANTKTVAIGEGVWERLKGRALKERTTVRDVLERAVSGYLAVVAKSDATDDMCRWAAQTEREYVTALMADYSEPEPVKELKYDPDPE